MEKTNSFRINRRPFWVFLANNKNLWFAFRAEPLSPPFLVSQKREQLTFAGKERQ
jgi:hypothetical protein